MLGKLPVQLPKFETLMTAKHNKRIIRLEQQINMFVVILSKQVQCLDYIFFMYNYFHKKNALMTMQSTSKDEIILNVSFDT